MGYIFVAIQFCFIFFPNGNGVIATHCKFYKKFYKFEKFFRHPRDVTKSNGQIEGPCTLAQSHLLKRWWCGLIPGICAWEASVIPLDHPGTKTATLNVALLSGQL